MSVHPENQVKKMSPNSCRHIFILSVFFVGLISSCGDRTKVSGGAVETSTYEELQELALVAEKIQNFKLPAATTSELPNGVSSSSFDPGLKKVANQESEEEACVVGDNYTFYCSVYEGDILGKDTISYHFDTLSAPVSLDSILNDSSDSGVFLHSF